MYTLNQRLANVYNVLHTSKFVVGDGIICSDFQQIF